MLTKNIRLVGYGASKNKKKIRSKVLNNLNRHLNNKLVQSFSKDYKYNFNSLNVKNFRKYYNYNIFGMGGSSLGVKAIYQFMKPKIKKKFLFLDNLNSRKNLKKIKTKTLNIIISKSGNTLETISNFSTLEERKNNIFICENNNNYIRQ